MLNLQYQQNNPGLICDYLATGRDRGLSAKGVPGSVVPGSPVDNFWEFQATLNRAKE